MSDFGEMKHYVGFSPADEERLRALRARIEPELDGVIDHFYAAIQAHPGAARVLRDAAQVRRLEGTLRRWLRELLTGPYDDAYHEQRARIGRMHVQVGLHGRYMFTAMDLIRTDLCALARRAIADRDEADATCDAIGRVTDLDLAIMTGTYIEDREERLRQREQEATLGRLAAMVHRELEEPLSVIRTSAYLLSRRADPLDERARSHLDKLERNAERATRMMGSLVSFGQAPTAPPVPCPLDPLVAEHLAIHPPGADVAVELARSAAEARVLADPPSLSRVLQQVLDNARWAAGPGGRVRVSTGVEGGRGFVDVADSGGGVAEADRDRVWEPLFSTRDRGAGLGLPLARALARAQGGDLVLRPPGTDPELGGAVFRVWLPLAQG